jgi:DNA-binding transcriptional LysR family regulator
MVSKATRAVPLCEALTIAARSRDEVRGSLRVSCPPQLPHILSPGPMTTFLSRYPLVRVQLHLSSRRVDLINERYDIATASTNSTEYVGPFAALIPGRRWTAAALSPDASQCALLTNPGFVLPPKFNRLFARMFRDRGFDRSAKFFCVSPAPPGPVVDGAAAPTSAETRAGTASRQRCARPGSH